MSNSISKTEWREVPGMPGVEVSSEGDIRGHSSGRTHTNQGYVKFSHQGILYALHRIVCLAFHGHPPTNKPRCLHWDDDPTNNRASNLRWGDAQDNIADAQRNGLFPVSSKLRRAA